MKTFIRDAIFDAINDLAQEDESIVLLTADTGAFGLERFRKEHPDRFYNVGIAEQALVAVASGLALAGKKVFVYGMATFVTMRCLEQIKVNVCLMDVPVFILGLGPGAPYGFFGPSHHSLNDIGIMRNMANMAVYSAIDARSCRYVVEEAVRRGKPAYIRMDTEAYEDLCDADTDLHAGFQVVHRTPAENGLIISTGICSHYAVAAETNRTLIDLFCVNTFDRDLLTDELKRCDDLIIYEEQWSSAGIASILSELIVDRGLNIRVRKLGVREEDCLAHIYGRRAWLHEQFRIAPESLKKAAGANT